MRKQNGVKRLLSFFLSLAIVAGCMWTFAPSADFAVIGFSLGDSNSNSNDVLGKSYPYGISATSAMLLADTYAIAGPYTSITKLGGTQKDFVHYNAVILEDFYGLQADSEGFLAVGGDAYLGSGGHGFDIGGAANYAQTASNLGAYGEKRLITKKPEFPGFLLQGSLVPNLTTASVNIYGDMVVPAGTLTSLPQNVWLGYAKWGYGSLRHVDPQIVSGFFDLAEWYMISWTEYLDRLADSKPNSVIPLSSSNTGLKMSNYTTQLANGTMTLNGDKVSVITLDSTPGDSIYLERFEAGSALDNYKFVIINVPHDTVEFKNDILSMSVATKVVWNFPNATNITHHGNGYMNGSMIAPYADIYGGKAANGSASGFNGRVYCRELTLEGGTELHNFKPDIDIPQLIEDDEEEIEYTLNTGDITLIKYGYENDSDTNPVKLSGAVFELQRSDDGGKTYNTYYHPSYNGQSQWTTTSAGTIVIDQLLYGHYRLIEVKAPTNYVTPNYPNNRIDFVVDAQTSTQQFSFPNYKNPATTVPPATGGAYLNKVSDDDPYEAPVEGAFFEVQAWNAETNTWVWITDHNGKNKQWMSDQAGLVEITGLEIGVEHQLFEVSAPYGFEDVDQTFITKFTPVENANKNMIYLGKVVNKAIWIKFGVIAYNEYSPPAPDYRVPYAHREVLPGVVYSIYYSPSGEDTIEGNWYYLGTLPPTDNNGEVDFEVPYRQDVTYRLAEGLLPYEEYVYSENNPYATAVIRMSSYAPNNQYFFPVLYHPDSSAAKIQLVKYGDGDQSNRLSGANFVLYEWANGKWVSTNRSYLTNQSGTFSVNLSEGTYRFKETSPPDGYLLPDGEDAYTERFSVDKDGNVTVNETPLPNNTLWVNNGTDNISVPKKDLTLEKIDSITGEPLKGAAFSLQKQNDDGSWSWYVTNVKTDKNGEINYSLPYGTYRLWEIDAPENYILSGGYIQFNITAHLTDGYVRTIENEPHDPGATYGDVTLIKHRTGNKDYRLFGAEFTLQKMNANGDFVDYTSGLISNSNGEIYLDSLPVGHYQFVEVKAPDGYHLEDTPIPFTITSGGTTTFVLEAPNPPISTNSSSVTDQDKDKPGSNTRDSYHNAPPAISTTGDETPDPPFTPSSIIEIASGTAPENPSTGVLSHLYANPWKIGFSLLGAVLLLLYRNKERYD